MLGRVFLRAATAALVLLAALVATAWGMLQRSLPSLDGTMMVAGLHQGVSIELDAAGIATVSAANRADLAFATGFAHAQDRYFQMDLTRRKSAGELAELFGPAALELDRRHRWHRFRSRAAAIVGGLGPRDAELLAAYTAGVNAGLDSLRARPFEYFLLGVSPSPWTPEDSLLVGFAMYLELNDERAERDRQRGYARRVLPTVVYDWLYPAGTSWDAPLMGAARALPPTPRAGDFDLRAVSASSQPQRRDEAGLLPGSNNWAVSGALSGDGRAIVAGDIHLGLAVPNVFYRLRLVQTGPDARELNGVSLPGTPLLTAGSNGYVAWAFTNSYGDWSDAVLLKPGATALSYRTPDGDEHIVEHRESIAVSGAATETLSIRETRWGPILEDAAWPDGELAVNWLAHYPDSINFVPVELETVRTAADALAIANRIAMPPQNFVCGDAAGNIGWTIAGRIPRRTGYDASVPADWSEREGWSGWLTPEEYPRLQNPAAGRIWTANARVADGDALAVIGDGGYDLGARARQIRDALHARDRFGIADMLDIQLDDRAAFLAPWRKLLLATLDDAAVNGHDGRRRYRQLAEHWVPRASAESVGYRLVRAFRTAVRDRVFAMLMQPVRDAYDGEVELLMSNQFEGPLWALLEEQPAHLLSADYASWRALLLEAIDSNIRYYDENFPGGLERRSWGETNAAAIRHPLSRAIGLLSPWLDMPREALNGDNHMPRVADPDFGPAERFAVSPGDEANGYLHMPAGQSGHPLSNFYRTGHSDWVQARATPLLPGETVHRLDLEPAGH